MKHLLSRILRIKSDSELMKYPGCRSNKPNTAAHEGFKTKPGQGPFLLSYDGRVIPLRKARFLHRR
jgi:hypothetical protein